MYCNCERSFAALLVHPVLEGCYPVYPVLEACYLVYPVLEGCYLVHLVLSVAIYCAHAVSVMLSAGAASIT